MLKSCKFYISRYVWYICMKCMTWIFKRKCDKKQKAPISCYFMLFKTKLTSRIPDRPIKTQYSVINTFSDNEYTRPIDLRPHKTILFPSSNMAFFKNVVLALALLAQSSDVIKHKTYMYFPSICIVLLFYFYFFWDLCCFL